jgi:hypothetical protein
MNFGRRWSEALTVTVLKRHERGFTAAGLSPKSLKPPAVGARLSTSATARASKPPAPSRRDRRMQLKKPRRARGRRNINKSA